MTYNAAATSFDGYNPPTPLFKDLPNPSALDYVDASTMYLGDWNGFIFRGNPTMGAYSTYAAGLGAIGDLAVDSTGKTYVASWGDHRVYQLMADGSRGKSWGTYYNYGMMARGPDGAYYIPDYSWNQILRLSNGTMSVYMSYDFGNPMGIAFDSGGNMYVSSWNRNYIYKVDGSKNVSVYKSGGGLSAPGAMAFDGSNNLYVTDWSNSKIRKIAPDGSKTMTDYAVIPSNPRGLARDPNTGDLYVGGWYDQTVYKVSGSDQAVTPVTTLGGAIWGLTRDAGSGDLYVACYGNSTVVRVPVSGGTNTVITANLGDPVGVLREPGKTIICRWTGSASVYEVSDGTTAWRVIGQGFWNPCGSVVDRTEDRYVYVSDWNSGTLVKLDTQLDSWTLVADSGDWSKGRNPIKGMAWGSDNMLYAQNWGGGVHRLDMSQVNRLNGNGVTFYGGNTSTMGILGGIVFGPNGVLYGTSWDWMRGSSTVVVGLPPGGLGSGVPGIAVNIWPNWVFF
ncbi:MAG TPA: NHL repeat-containing protein [Stenomitos sp.]